MGRNTHVHHEDSRGRGQASEERCAERTPGKASCKSGLTATDKDGASARKQRDTEARVLTHASVGAMRVRSCWPEACASGSTPLSVEHVHGSCADVRPAKADAFSGSESRQGKSQEPCSLDGREEGNRISEAHRQCHLRDGSESPGRSASEHRSGPENEAPRRPSPQP